MKAPAAPTGLAATQLAPEAAALDGVAAQWADGEEEGATDALRALAEKTESPELWLCLVRALCWQSVDSKDPAQVRAALHRARAAAAQEAGQGARPIDVHLDVLATSKSWIVRRIFRRWHGAWEIDREEAQLENDQQRWAEGLAAAERFAASCPDKAEARYFAGRALEFLGCLEEATAAYGAALDRLQGKEETERTGVWAALGRARVGAARGQIDEVVADLAHALEHDPEVARAVEETPAFEAVRAHTNVEEMIARARRRHLEATWSARVAKLAALREEAIAEFESWDEAGTAGDMRALVLGTIDELARAERPEVGADRKETDQACLLAATAAAKTWASVHHEEGAANVVAYAIVGPLREVAHLVNADDVVDALDELRDSVL